MAALWESSTRSLFVKTVWKDGHRHVLLQEETEKYQKSSREPPKLKLDSSRPAVPNRPLAPHLRVPSVKLRLKKFRSLRIDSVKTKKGKKSSKTNKRMVSHESQDEVEEVRIEPEDTRLKSQYNENKYRKITKSFTIDVEDASRNSILADNYPVGTKFLQSDDHFTSLSDRVLMWLDLATQNGLCSESVANFKRIPLTKSRIATAGFFQSSKTYHNRIENTNLACLRNYRLAYDEDDSFTSEDCYSSDDSILKCNGINMVTEKMEGSGEIVSEEFNDHLISSRENNKVSCCANDKRQLHIFMPYFPQIMLEVDEVSVISKCSSIVRLNEA